jgi:hypothetical protein
MDATGLTRGASRSLLQERRLSGYLTTPNKDSCYLMLGLVVETSGSREREAPRGKPVHLIEK